MDDKEFMQELIAEMARPSRIIITSNGDDLHVEMNISELVAVHKLMNVTVSVLEQLVRKGLTTVDGAKKLFDLMSGMLDEAVADSNYYNTNRTEIRLNKDAALRQVGKKGEAE